MKTLTLFLARSRRANVVAVLLGLATLASGPRAAVAADIIKANNTDNLNLSTSWTLGTAPTASDVAVFASTYATTGSLGTGGLVTWQGVRVASPGGAVIINNGTAGNEVAIGSAGIDMSAATVNMNIQRLRVDASQDWNIASGRTFNLGSSTAVRSGVLSLGSGSPFTITKKGAGTVQLDTGNNAIGNVNWDIHAGVIRAIWNGSSAWGTGTITLGGGGIATGTSFTGSEGNWTWTNNITLTSSTNSFIDNQNIGGSNRFLKLTGVMSGSGNVEFRDTGIGFGNADFGFILAGTNTNTGTVTIASGAEVRVGATTTNDGNTGNNGRLAATTAAVTNNGTLSFSRLDAHTVANNISGSGSVRVGLSAVVGTATTTQNVTLSGTNTYSGATTINNGTLTLTGSLSASSAVSVAAGATLTGNGTAAGTVAVASTGILSPGLANAGTLSLGSLTFGTAAGNTASILMPVSVGGTLNSRLSVTGNVVANGGVNSVTFGFGSNLALLGAGTYTLMSYTGTQLTDIAAFTYSGSAGSRQTVQLVNASQAIDLSVGNAFVIWSGAQGSGWSTANNWTLSSDNLPTTFQASDVVIFNDSGTTGTVDLTANVAPVTVTFNGDTLAYTVGSANASGITSGSLVKTGAATVTMNAANSFAGGTQLTAGTLVLGNAAALGSGSVSLEGGRLDLNAQSITNAVVLAGGSLAGNGGTVSGAISETGGARALVVGSSLTLTGTNTYTGGTTVNAGTLQVGGGSTTGTLGGGGVTVAAGAGLAFNRSDNLTIANAISGDGVLVKQGAGILTLTGTNSYAGTTTISAGTLRIGSGSTAGTLGSGNVVNNAALSVSRSDSITVANTISGTGSLSHDSTGTTTLSASNTYTGVTTIRGNNGTSGEVRVSAINNGGVAGNLGQATSEAANIVLGQTGTTTGRLVYTGAGESTDRLFTIDGNAVIENNGTGPLNFTNTGDLGKTSGISQSFTLGGTSGGSLAARVVKGAAGSSDVTVVKNGTGTWALSGASTYTGTTTINQGTLSITGSGALGGASGSTADANNIVFGSTNSNAALRFETAANLGAADQIRFRNTGGTIGLGAALVYVGTTDQTVSKTIQCDTSIGMRIESNSVGGSLTLNGAFSQTNRPLFLGGTGTGNNTLAIAFDGTGGLTKRDAGAWLLSAVNGYSGGTEALGGKVRVNALSGIGSGYLAVKNGATFSYEGSAAETTTRNLFLDGGASRIDVTNASGSLTWNDSSAKNGAFTKGGAGSLSIGGAFSGGASVTVADGRLTLTGSSTYSGSTTVSGGTLRLGSGGGVYRGGFFGGSVVSVSGGGLLELQNWGYNTTTGSLGGLANTATAIVINGGTIRMNGTTAYGRGVTVQGGGATFEAAASSTWTFDDAGDGNVPFVYSGNPSLTFSGDGSFVFNKAFSSSGTLTKNGTGFLTLTGQGHAGAFAINQGTLNVNAASALGAATSLALASGVTLDNTSLAAVTVNNATLSTSLGSALTFLGTQDLSLGTGPATLSANAAINVTAGTLTFGGEVGDGGSGFGITKAGAGTLVLAGLSSSAFTGNSVVNAGELFLSGTSTLGGGSGTTVTLNAGGTLRIGATASTGGVTVVMAGGQTIYESLQPGPRTFTVNQALVANDDLSDGVQTIAAGVVVSSAADWLGSIPASATPGRIVMENGATLRSTNAVNINANKGISLAGASATFDADAGSIFINSQVTGAGKLVKTGPGGFRILNQANDYAGGTDILEGTFGIYGDGSLGQAGTSVFIDGGTLNSGQGTSGQTVTIGSARSLLLGNGKASNLDATNGSTLAYAGVITEADGGGAAASLRIGTAGSRAGTVELGGANTYRGDTIINAGTLALTSAGSFGNSPRIIVGDGTSIGAVLDLSAKSSFSIGSSQTLMGGGTVALGGGTLTVSGTFAPGNSPGLFTYSGGTTLLAGTTELEIWGTARATSPTHGDGFYDAVDIVSAGSLDFGDSALNLSFDSLLAAGDLFELFKVFDTASLVGNFGSVSVTGGFYTDLTWSKTGTGWNSSAAAGGESFVFSASTGTLVVVPEPGTVALAAAGLGLAAWAVLRRRLRIRRREG